MKMSKLQASKVTTYINGYMNTCNRVFMVSNGVVMQDAVAPATIPPAA